MKLGKSNVLYSMSSQGSRFRNVTKVDSVIDDDKIFLGIDKMALNILLKPFVDVTCKTSCSVR